jgi:hypothetical protein
MKQVASKADILLGQGYRNGGTMINRENPNIFREKPASVPVRPRICPRLNQ